MDVTVGQAFMFLFLLSTIFVFVKVLIFNEHIPGSGLLVRGGLTRSKIVSYFSITADRKRRVLRGLRK